MELSINMFLIVCPLVFLGGLVDSIAGGGGLISLPAYLIAGLPAHNAVATNKLSSASGSVVATLRYMKNGCINLKLIPSTVVAALIGSTIGAKLILLLNEEIIKYVILIVLPIIAILMLRKKNPLEQTGEEEISLKKQIIIATIAAFVIGMYDGFYGPGTGTFLVLTLTGLAKLEARVATGTTKCINLTSNTAALVTFLINGKVYILLGAVAAVFGIAGNYIGSGMVVKSGSKYIKPLILVVVFMLACKIIFE